MTPVFYAFRNRAGRLLRAISGVLLEGNPALARNLLPDALRPDALAPYRVPERGPLYARLLAGHRAGEVAWLYYPAKRDRVETVFSCHDGVWCVEKRVLRRCPRGKGCRFRQRALPREPLLRGELLGERFRRLAEARAWDALRVEIERYLRALPAAFPEAENGRLPPHALDAVPRNCMIDDEGRYRFFDLEYEAAGGCTPSYLLYSTVKADVVSHLPKRERNARLRELYAGTCRRLGLPDTFDADRRQARQLKAFTSRSPARLLTRLLMAVTPVASWRRRMMWWDTAVALAADPAPRRNRVTG